MGHVSKSARNVSDALKDRGIEASPETVRATLRRLGYGMQGNRKDKSIRAGHPDREAPFQHIKKQRGKAITGKDPVIAVDTKKKEVRGGYKNGGKRSTGRGKPRGGLSRFCPPDALRAYPYGAYTI